MHEDDPPQSETAEAREDGTDSVVDVVEETMLDLLHRPTPEIREAVARLLAEGAYRDDVLMGWNSFLR